MARRNYHVIAQDNRWAVKREGRSRACSIHDTQRDAIDAGKRAASSENGDLLIHARNGRIRERNSYGSDPLPSKAPRAVLFPPLKSKAKEKAIRKAVREVISESNGKDMRKR